MLKVWKKVYKVARFDVLMKVIVKILVIRIVRPCGFWVDTDVSEELIASIFRVEICSLRNMLGYMGNLVGGFSFFTGSLVLKTTFLVTCSYKTYIPELTYFNLEDGGSICLRSIVIHPQNCMMSQARRPQSSMCKGSLRLVCFPEFKYNCLPFRTLLRNDIFDLES
jgi:hypothetical protein